MSTDKNFSGTTWKTVVQSLASGIDIETDPNPLSRLGKRTIYVQIKRNKQVSGVKSAYFSYVRTTFPQPKTFEPATTTPERGSCPCFTSATLNDDYDHAKAQGYAETAPQCQRSNWTVRFEYKAQHVFASTNDLGCKYHYGPKSFDIRTSEGEAEACMAVITSSLPWIEGCL